MTLTINEFGAQLLRSGDLDPVYIMLRDAKLPRPLLKRWVIAYTWFYHVGVASYLCEQPSMEQAALQELDIFPRGSERRHFRAVNARKCLDFFARRRASLQGVFGDLCQPENITREWFDIADLSFEGILQRIQQTPQYGPWMAFKLYDIGVNVLYPPTMFNLPKPDALKMYSEPTKGAKLVANEGESVGDVVTRLLEEFKGFKNPTHPRRNITVLEVETILCKYKSHRNGHYLPGKDTHEVKEALDWRPCAVADHLKETCSLWS